MKFTSDKLTELSPKMKGSAITTILNEYLMQTKFQFETEYKFQLKYLEIQLKYLLYNRKTTPLLASFLLYSPNASSMQNDGT